MIGAQTASKLRAILKKYLNALDKFNGARYKDVIVREASQITAKELRVAIPPSLRYRPTKATTRRFR